MYNSTLSLLIFLMSATIKKISIISPCLNESQGLYKCHSAVKDLFSSKLSSYEYEHIFSDNNSSDGSKEILRKIANEDKNAKIIFNTSNYGSQKSIFNSLYAINLCLPSIIFISTSKSNGK